MQDGKQTSGDSFVNGHGFGPCMACGHEPAQQAVSYTLQCAACAVLDGTTAVQQQRCFLYEVYAFSTQKSPLAVWDGKE